MPQYNTLFGMSLMTITNLFIVPIVMKKLLILDFLGFIPKSLLVITFSVIIVVNYFLMVHRKKYLKIIDDFNYEQENIRRKNAFLLWLYVAASFAAPLLIIKL